MPKGRYSTVEKRFQKEHHRRCQSESLKKIIIKMGGEASWITLRILFLIFFLKSFTHRFHKTEVVQRAT